VRDDSSEGDFDNVQEAFEALAQNLDNMLALNAADGADPEVAERLEKARALALRGSAKLRDVLDRPR